jgi:hypothetical protein
VWNFDGETRAIPELGMMDAGKVAYTHVNQMANGGYFLETRRTGTGPNAGHRALCLQLQRRVEDYRQDGYNNRGGSNVHRHRRWATWTFSGTNTSLDGQVTKERFVRSIPRICRPQPSDPSTRKTGTPYERLTGTHQGVRGATGRRRSRRSVVAGSPE